MRGWISSGRDQAIKHQTCQQTGCDFSHKCSCKLNKVSFS